MSYKIKARRAGVLSSGRISVRINIQQVWECERAEDRYIIERAGVKIVINNDIYSRLFERVV